jgi:hypothetical protein
MDQANAAATFGAPAEMTRAITIVDRRWHHEASILM